MKLIKKTFIILFLTCTIIQGAVRVIVFDCSGSFIGPNEPEILVRGSLLKINELIASATHNDTIIFFPIRENSTVSSLNQIMLVKEKATSVFDPSVKQKNSRHIKTFVKQVLDEINKPYAKRTDIITAINYASAIAKNYTEASIYVFSDGRDNINAELFKRLENISIFHLFIFDRNSGKQNKLISKWDELYKKLGAKSVHVYDAQASMTKKIGIK